MQCPHSQKCPRLNEAFDKTPCNFEVSYTPLNFIDKQNNHLNTKYSYVALKNGNSHDETQNWPRLVRPTLKRSKHVICRMCTSEAKLQEIIFTQSKHGRLIYNN